jgi:hypothetical protein
MFFNPNPTALLAQAQFKIMRREAIARAEWSEEHTAALAVLVAEQGERKLNFDYEELGAQFAPKTKEQILGKIQLLRDAARAAAEAPARDAAVAAAAEAGARALPPPPPAATTQVLDALLGRAAPVRIFALQRTAAPTAMRAAVKRAKPVASRVHYFDRDANAWRNAAEKAGELFGGGDASTLLMTRGLGAVADLGGFGAVAYMDKAPKRVLTPEARGQLAEVAALPGVGPALACALLAARAPPDKDLLAALLDWLAPSVTSYGAYGAVRRTCERYMLCVAQIIARSFRLRLFRAV